MAAPRRRKNQKNSDKKLFMLLFSIPLLVVGLLMVLAWFIVAVKTGEIPDASSILVVFKHFVDLFFFMSGDK